MIDACYLGDVRDGLRAFIAAGVRAQTCVTSPPYWGLRDYGTAQWDGGDAAHDHDRVSARNGRGGSGSPGKQTDGAFPSDFPAALCSCGARRIDRQLGLEPTPAEYVANMVEVFRLLRDVLANDGTLWLNIGDSYATGAGKVGNAPGGGAQGAAWSERGAMTSPNRMPIEGLKPKDLVGIPWRLAFALQADGWYLRSDVIWHKPNPMPESITDRPTKSHEYVFLLAKRERYFYDADAITEPASESTHARLSQNVQAQIGSERANGGAKTNGNMKAVARKASGADPRMIASAAPGAENRKFSCKVKDNANFDSAMAIMPLRRNKRTVWTIPTESYSEAHFATFPTALVEPCVLAGSRPGDVVLDPFMGSGTVAQVAQDLGRRWIGCELNPEYVALQSRRAAQQGLALA